MDTITGVIDHAERRCKENGSRLTEKRKTALSLLLKSQKALSAYELVDAYKAELGESIPPMSMYRILHFLIAEKLVHRLDLANKYVACEHINCGHDSSQLQFLICGKCQKVKEVSVSHVAMAEIKENIRNSGFRPVSPQLEMICICEECMAE